MLQINLHDEPIQVWVVPLRCSASDLGRSWCSARSIDWQEELLDCRIQAFDRTAGRSVDTSNKFSERADKKFMIRTCGHINSERAVSKVMDLIRQTGSTLLETTAGSDYALDLHIQLPEYPGRFPATPEDGGWNLSNRYVHIQVKYRSKFLTKGINLKKAELEAWSETPNPTYLVIATESHSDAEASADVLELHWLTPERLVSLNDSCKKWKVLKEKMTLTFSFIEFHKHADRQTRFPYGGPLAALYDQLLDESDDELVLSLFWIENLISTGGYATSADTLKELVGEDQFLQLVFADLIYPAEGGEKYVLAHPDPVVAGVGLMGALPGCFVNPWAFLKHRNDYKRMVLSNILISTWKPALNH